MGTYRYSGTPTFVTVKNDGTFTIVADGAQGGTSTDQYTGQGGYGAEVGGNFNLSAGERLEIFVGGAGSYAYGGAGGGGGTFVLGSVNGGAYALLVAAGGGGGGIVTSYKGLNGTDASFSAASGTGNGGAGANNYGGGGGAGFTGFGGNGSSNSGYQVGTGGTSVTATENKGAGGTYVAPSGSPPSSYGQGGFGGGGGGGGYGGGGGGGYTGGNAGSKVNGVSTAAAGGTSFDSGTSTVARSAMAENMANAGNGQVTITPNAVCFAAGTSIRVARGGSLVDVAVQELQVGDLAVTASGVHRPIKWLGHRTVDCRAHRDPRQVWPIRVAAGAFGENKPARDLFLSPGHSVCVTMVEELFVPINALINGATIAQVEVDTVTYWHVELDSHDVLLAENLPAESYLDMGNRVFFAQSAVVDLHASPDAAAPAVDPAGRTNADFCRPFFADGAMVEFVGALLVARAKSLGWSMTRDLGLHLLVDGRRIDGDNDGDLTRFVFPAATREAYLVSETFVPAHAGVADHRRLGVAISSLGIGDGLRHGRQVAIDDPLFDDAFHPEEANDGVSWRWTMGRLRLPAALWAQCRTHVLLRVEHGAEGGLRWIAPLDVNTCAEADEAGNVVSLRVA